MNINQPLRTLSNVRHAALDARTQLVGLNWSHLTLPARDLVEAAMVDLDAIVRMCTRYEPFHVNPEEES